METSLAEFFGHTSSAAVATEVCRAIARAMITAFVRLIELPLSIA